MNKAFALLFLFLVQFVALHNMIAYSEENQLFKNSNLSYKENILHFEEVDLLSFAQKQNSPFYIYSKNVIERNINKYQNAITKYNINGKVFFAVKSNLNREIIKIINKKNCGADTTSIGEIEESLNSGVKGHDIIFSGVGKTNEELTFAIKNNVHINCESINEIKAINTIAEKLKKIINISVRINPEVDGHTHSKISTGKKGDKFGILMADLLSFQEEIKTMRGVKINGIAFHIGSQITEIESFSILFQKIKDIYTLLVNNNLQIDIIDLGGGVGIAYQEEDKTISIESYMKSLNENLISKLPKKINYHFEPGRFIVANAGILIANVTYIKKSGDENFAILNAGMNNLIRPAMYDSYHEITPVLKREKEEVYNIAGPVCESSDFFAKNRQMKTLQEGDFVAILCSGAYGQSMASMYNARNIISEFIIEGDKIRKIRKEVKLADIASYFYN